MTHYLDGDILTSHHRLAPRDALRSRSKCLAAGEEMAVGGRVGIGSGMTNGLTKRKVARSFESGGGLPSHRARLESVSELHRSEDDQSTAPDADSEAAALAAAKQRMRAQREAARARYVQGAGRRSKRPTSPFGLKPSRALQLDWQQIPLVSRFLVSGVLLVIIALTTPFWAYVQSLTVDFATFGLWHFCIDTSCWSLHDNLVKGHDIPLWYLVSQMTFTIGVICATLAMFVVTSNHRDGRVRLSPTTNSTMVMMLIIGVLQMGTGLYTFEAYFRDVSFMYETVEDVEEVDLYGAFWISMIGNCLILISAVMLFFDEQIVPYPHMYGAPCHYPPSHWDQNNYYPGTPPPYPGSPTLDEPGSPGPESGYPDNALFSELPHWDQRRLPSILSQRDIPCGVNPAFVEYTRPKVYTSEDFHKKST